MASKEKLLIATNNSGKLKEFALLLPEFEVISQSVLNIIPEKETGQTFFENSLFKARFAAKSSGLLSLGDDSGLIVPALNNLPGLHSARYAGDGASDQENRDYLKQELGNLNLSETKAYFVCVLTMIQDPCDPLPFISTGLLGGLIRIESKGVHGFGYDEMFYPEGWDESLAEMDTSAKANLSHRGKAIQNLKEKIAKLSTE